MNWLQKLICPKGIEIPKPEIEYLSTSSVTLVKQLDGLGLQLMHPCLLDAGDLYWFTKLEHWQRVFQYIDDAVDYLSEEFPMFGYIKARRDCEDYAILHKGLVSAFFGLNAYGVVTGSTPFGYHAFNLLKTDRGFRLWEPQIPPDKQVPFRINDEQAYTPMKILI